MPPKPNPQRIDEMQTELEKIAITLIGLFPAFLYATTPAAPITAAAAKLASKEKHMILKVRRKS